MELYDVIYSENTDLYHRAKSFTCTWPNCGRSFAFNDVFKLHLSLHDDVKPLKSLSDYSSQVQEIIPNKPINIKQEIDDNHRNGDSDPRVLIEKITDSSFSNLDTLPDLSLEIKTGLLEEYGDYQITEPTTEFESQRFMCKKENLGENLSTPEKNPNCTNDEIFHMSTGDHLETKSKNFSNIKGNHLSEEELHLKNYTAAYPSDINWKNCTNPYDRDIIQNVEIINSHVTKLNDKQIFVCAWKDCTKSYKSAKWLKQHRQNYHGESDNNCICSCSNCMNDNPQSNITKQHICDFDGCGKVFLAPSHLLMHARIHNGPFVCNFVNCAKSFRLDGMLKRHQRLHTRSKNYACLECDFKCVRSDNLAKHKKTHTNYPKQKFICDFDGCSEQFSAPSRLLAHAQTHIVVRSFVCNFENCTKSFERSDELDEHRRKHSNEKRFECPECGLKCIRLVYLAMHKKTHFS